MRIARCQQTRPHLRWLSLTLVALLLGGCASKADIMDNLNKTLRGYEKAVRWAKFDAVYSFHKWETDEQPTIPASMENIRVTKYEASRQKFNQKNKTMKETISLRYYNTDNVRELSVKHIHEWKYFPKLKRWYLISEPIVFPQ